MGELKNEHVVPIEMLISGLLNTLKTAISGVIDDRLEKLSLARIMFMSKEI